MQNELFWQLNASDNRSQPGYDGFVCHSLTRISGIWLLLFGELAGCTCLQSWAYESLEQKPDENDGAILRMGTREKFKILHGGEQPPYHKTLNL